MKKTGEGGRGKGEGKKVWWLTVEQLPQSQMIGASRKDLPQRDAEERRFGITR